MTFMHLGRLGYRCEIRKSRVHLEWTHPPNVPESSFGAQLSLLNQTVWERRQLQLLARWPHQALQFHASVKLADEFEARSIRKPRSARLRSFLVA